VTGDGEPVLGRTLDCCGQSGGQPRPRGGKAVSRATCKQLRSRAYRGATWKQKCEAISYAPAVFPRADLQLVRASGCANITDEGLRHLGSVTTLDLTDCSQITDEGLRHLGSVTTLDVEGCDLITVEVGYEWPAAAS